MKILVIRFSSIGDIVLTSPVLRCLKNQIPDCELHFLTKSKFREVVQNNIYLDKIYFIERSFFEIKKELKTENYDVIIDLHNNIRTLLLKFFLVKKSYSFPKLNVKKWLYVNFKINLLPKVHVVDRYFETVKKLNVQNDFLPCDYFLEFKDGVDLSIDNISKPFITVALGSQFYTKRIPFQKLNEIFQNLDLTIVLLGDNNDKVQGEKLIISNPNKKIINYAGTLTLNQSAFVVKNSELLITGDTGLMHIASAFETKIISIWGNTTPDFGMFPYTPSDKNKSVIYENNLSCRPCSKIGFKSCPKNHFSCMNNHDINIISKKIQEILKTKSI